MILQKFYKSFSLAGEAVSLEQLLAAREARALLQQACLAKYGQTILSLTLTAVGGVKKNPLLDYVFAKALENLTACFATLSVSPIAEFIRPLETGHEALFVVPIEADRLKRAAMALEESSPLARLWDIDVISAEGRLLSRGEFGRRPRACLVCEGEAKLCARSRKHTLEAILTEMQQRVSADAFAEQIAEFVYQALLTEARLTPKPGLVDSLNTGAHQDMDLLTFERSALALRPYFAAFVRKGMATSALSVSQILAEIRPLGLRAEQAMLGVTDGVNTHKGSIFAFGLVCAAIGRLAKQQTVCSVAEICAMVSQFAQGLTLELQNYPENRPLTAGAELFKLYGLTGARGEAESGFKLVRAVLPVLEEYPELDTEHQRFIVLLTLMATNQDTNVVYRGGPEGLQFVQDYAKGLLNDPRSYQDKAFLIARLQEFDAACIQKNLSAGGSADLLALTIFFQSLRGN